MSFRTDLLGVKENIRASVYGSIDVAPNRLTIRVRSWSGGRRGMGTPTDTDLVLPQHYPIREVSAREVASSGGLYELGDVKVDCITPADGAGAGYTPEQLAPTNTDAQETIYVLTGPMAGEYRRIDLKRDRAFRYTLVLRRTERTPL